ncbi:hypothetical protein M758_10G069300 [Ceratodon purpureus]|uniref:Uncharacterized protein n=1 Tax=Ceratodon purpureus TaxID=3225 RepID=A0A8T0GPS4_CERPU|nr:hypothetical protein KC19_10G071600 [Ceratodon purpureus]KAG0603135.1 hypothetical protein M758_10G069300 [Ceratodon purpureus]
MATIMASSDAVEAAAYASKYRKYERDYLRRINHLYFSSTGPDNGELFDSNATIDDFVINESKDAPLKKFLQTSGLVNAELATSKVEPMDIDINLPSTSTKKSQRATPEGNRKSSARGK